MGTDIDKAQLEEELRKNPVFAGCKEELLESAIEAAEILQFAGEDTVVEEGDEASLNILLSGAIRVYHSHEGKQVTVKHLRPPVTFGEMNILAGIGFAQGVQALTDLTLVRFPAKTLRSLLEDPTVSKRLLEDVSGRFWLAERNQLNLVVDAPGRLAGLLVSYAEILGVEVDGGVRIERPLSNDALANALGVVPKSVSRAMGQWKKDGLVSRKEGRLVLHDVGALEKLAGALRGHLNYRYEPQNDPSAS